MLNFNIKKIGVVTVFYNPEVSSAVKFIEFANAGYKVVIANNGMSDSIFTMIICCENIKVVGCGKNVGLAGALNSAVDVLLASEQIEGFVLFDQDSLPDMDLPVKLHDAYSALCNKYKIGCIGPRIIDIKDNSKKLLMTDNDIFLVDTVVTSGTYINKFVYKKVGSFKEDLFIDCVDHEWCFRAINMGYINLINFKTSMLHNMGEAGFNWFGKFKPLYKSPVRHYYIVRNTTYMLRLDYVPWAWKITEIFKFVRRILFYVAFSNNRVLSIKNVVTGLYDGISGKLGRLNG